MIYTQIIIVLLKFECIATLKLSRVCFSVHSLEIQAMRFLIIEKRVDTNEY